MFFLVCVGVSFVGFLVRYKIVSSYFAVTAALIASMLRATARPFGATRVLTF
jgi:hypothetical protein